jgi:hypothetical protein
MRNRFSAAAAVLILVLAGSVQPSWGWRGWGWGLGFWGPAVAVAATAPYWDPYYYGPYYSPYDYPPGPYASAPVGAYPAYRDAAPAPAEEASTPDNGKRTLDSVKSHLAQMREEINYKYDDGDMNRGEKEAAIHYLAQIADLAKSESAANGGYLMANQEDALLDAIQRADPGVHRDPSAPYPAVTPTAAASALPAASMPGVSSERTTGYYNLAAINDLLLELRTLLDQKLKDGDITRAQHDSELNYLAEMEKDAQAGADPNTIVQQLHHAYYTINHNFISH